MRHAETILAAIATFHPDLSRRAVSGEAWLDLDDLVEELALAPPSVNIGGGDAPGVDAARILLGVFERFPRHDGYEVFWTLLHHVEALAGYEPTLIASVRRVPNEMGLIMVRRLLNGGVSTVEGVDLQVLLRELTPLAPAIDYFVEPPP